eukprot:4640122-Pleurochrysis_carterae.AAC.1
MVLGYVWAPRPLRRRQSARFAAWRRMIASGGSSDGLNAKLRERERKLARRRAREQLQLQES